MCGICGFAITDDGPRPPLRAMMSLLKHRGPDDEGELDDGRIAIGNRRLAIIDVSGGNQPISNEDQSIWVVLNGEIYNYLDLREKLVRHGHTFSTKTDTEALAHLYEERREDMFQELRGMFAVCIYDRRESSLTIARDPFGEKPLYYAQLQGSLVFSSEVTSLLECENIPRRLDYESLAYYLRVGFVPAPLTMFQDVRQVEPGCWVKWKDGKLSQGRYWNIDYRTDVRLRDEPEVEEEVEEALRRAVSRQLVSERPLGAFLSGGIDSSTIVSFCQEILPNPVKTFTVGFEESSYDESIIAQNVADFLGTDHYEHRVANSGFREEQLWNIIDHVGLPFSDSSAIPMGIISEVASRHVTVCLSGDGGDEMFGGYPALRWGQSIRQLGKLPRSVLELGARTANWASRIKGLSHSSLVRQASRAFQAAQAEGLSQFLELHSLYNPEEINALLAYPETREIAQAPLDRITVLPEGAEEWTHLKKLMYFRLKFLLPEDMLVKVDRMSMSCSLEVRAPFLDVDLAKLAMALPDRFLLRKKEQKYIIRQIARKRLPPEVLSHPKTGFSIPIHRVQNQEYCDLANDLLGCPAGLTELFSQKALDSLLNVALTRKRDMADISVYRITHQLWALMQFAAWGKRFGVAL